MDLHRILMIISNAIMYEKVDLTSGNDKTFLTHRFYGYT